MGDKTSIHVSLDVQCLAAIDQNRGSQSRSDFINNLIWFATVATDEEIERIEIYWKENIIYNVIWFEIAKAISNQLK
jgi:hypothetical protein